MAKLYLVPTPIGNLEDITFRAIRILKEAGFILAEDTRKTSILLKHYGIVTPMIPHHAFNEHRELTSVIGKIRASSTAALVSDAGTPGISDPGFLLVRECIREHIEVECLPGPAAFLPALVASGLPCDTFHFEGFLPHKKGRQTRLKELSGKEETLVLYESPFRLVKTLEQLAEAFGPGRRASVSRELTKIHEETVRGTLAEILEHYKEKTVKGEIVIVVEGKQRSHQDTDYTEKTDEHGS
ncbi:MAG TPA: 16S rRNA (cytidine(1402)-2'-O)-methyltransferase [Bacteroidales bacterium]|nr:16S rRNA (cytidine(1402)-2'-O)-methyltransferase [Bacteroidales bacterium]